MGSASGFLIFRSRVEIWGLKFGGERGWRVETVMNFDHGGK